MAPREKSAECQCHGVGPSDNIGPYTITRGRGRRRGRDRNDATWGATDNDGKLRCRHNNNDNCDSRPPSNQNPTFVTVPCCQWWWRQHKDGDGGSGGTGPLFSLSFRGDVDVTRACGGGQGQVTRSEDGKQQVRQWQATKEEVGGRRQRVQLRMLTLIN